MRVLPLHGILHLQNNMIMMKYITMITQLITHIIGLLIMKLNLDLFIQFLLEQNFTVYSAMFAAENNNGGSDINTVIEGYNVSNTGIAETTPLYSMNATPCTSGELSEVDLGGWCNFAGGSFLISMTALSKRFHVRR